MFSTISWKQLHCELYAPYKHVLCGHIKGINAQGTAQVCSELVR